METLKLLEKRITRTVVQDALIAVVVFGLALVAIAAAVTRARSELDGRTIMMGVMGLGNLWAAWVMAQSARALWPARSSKVYTALAADGQNIGWAHLTTGSFTALKVYFLDGTMCTLYAGRRDAEALLAFVEERAPHAVLGFGADQEAAYVALVNQRRASQGLTS